MFPAHRPLALTLLLLLTACLAGCATFPSGLVGPPSQAMVRSEETTLGRIAQRAQPDSDFSGFRLMPNGDFALAARLELVRRAERALDVQYYHVENDDTGRHFLCALRDAGLRGVRVRLLMDDLYTAGEDELLLGLAATPNIEVRLFNPFPAARGGLTTRFAATLLHFDHMQRRMHNKLLVADGAVAVAGGRNIGGRYYRLGADENFIDIDTLVAGALVPRLGALFDQYWNSPYVLPVQRVASSGLPPDELRRRFNEATAAAPPPPQPAPNDLLGYAPVAEDLDGGRLGLVWALAEAYADAPGRAVGKTADYGGVPLLDVASVRYNVVEQMRRAAQEVMITSPYLIPGKAGLDVLREIRGRGVGIKLITNSLAATDEPLVHTAYRRYRAEMLRLGMDLYELSSQRTRRSVRLGLFGTPTGRLHAKTAVFDRRVLFIGSMNFDPRSEANNTELGIFVSSEVLAQQVVKLAEQLTRFGAYRLRLAADSSMEWVGTEGIGLPPVVLHAEPDSGFWQRAILELLAPLAPESLL